MSDLSRLYDQDYAVWAARNAELLKQGRFAELDVAHLLDELSDMSKSNVHELINRLRVLLAHLLKWQFQYQQLSARWQEFDGRSWRSSILEQRAALHYLLDEHPGLKNQWDQAVLKGYREAVRLALKETALPSHHFPAVCPYSQEQILDDDYFPPNEHV